MGRDGALWKRRRDAHTGSSRGMGNVIGLTRLRPDRRGGDTDGLGCGRGQGVEKQGQVVERLATNSVTAVRIQAFGTLAMIGGALLTIGAILVDLGWFVDLPAITSLGNALSAISGLGLLFPSFGLRASHLGGKGILPTAGTVTLAIGILLASLVDVPTILDPTDLEPGGAMGPAGLLLLSIGFVAWFVAIRRAGGPGGLATVRLACRRFVVPP
jgi:hypothetical protein